MAQVLLVVLLSLAASSLAQVVDTSGLPGLDSGKVDVPVDPPVDPPVDQGPKTPCNNIENWLDTPFGECVKVFQSAPITWDEAQKECNEYGGELLTITDRRKSQWIKSLLHRGHRGQTYWLGGKFQNQGTQGQGWYWQGTPVTPLSFGEFSAGEPNSLFRSRAEACMIIGANLQWWDDPCTTSNRVINSICQKPMANVGTGGNQGMGNGGTLNFGK